MKGLTAAEKVLVREGQSILAMKSYRNRTGSSLAESKSIVDEWRKNHRTPLDIK